MYPAPPATPWQYSNWVNNSLGGLAEEAVFRCLEKIAESKNSLLLHSYQISNLFTIIKEVVKSKNIDRYEELHQEELFLAKLYGIDQSDMNAIIDNK